MNYILINKNVKRITLKLNSEGELVVTAPFNTSKGFIEEIIENNKHIIEEKIKEFKMINKNKNKYFYLLGEKYSLVDTADRKIILDRENKTLSLDFKFKDDIIERVYTDLAKEMLPALTRELTLKHSFKISRVTVKKMKSRWGSCNHKKGYINLNSELIKYKEDVIKYVIIHELCHLIHPNHSKDFYKEVSRYCPNYKELSNVLKERL